VKTTVNHRHVGVALAVSFVLHVLALWVADVFVLAAVKPPLRARYEPRPQENLDRFVPTPAMPVSHELLERLRQEIVDPLVDMEMPNLAPYDSLSSEEGLSVVDHVLDGAQERGWTALPGVAMDELDEPDLVDLSPAAEQIGVPRVDPVALDAMRHERTVVVTDARTGRLKQAYVHLPVYMAGGRRNPAASLRSAKSLIERGLTLPGRVPVEFTFADHRLGGAIERPPEPPGDPIHRFTLHPRRQVLHSTQMAEYPVLYLPYIDVESTEAMVQYLIDGGFGVVDRRQLDLLEEAMSREEPERLQSVSVGLEHPLFQSYFDISQYSPGNCGCCPPPSPCPDPPCCICPCPPVQPLAGLQLDDRLIAVEAPPPYHNRCGCPSNALYVNVLVYGLQTHRMAGRFTSE
jgi:hypothetical protein